MSVTAMSTRVSLTGKGVMPSSLAACKAALLAGKTVLCCLTKKHEDPLAGTALLSNHAMPSKQNAGHDLRHQKPVFLDASPGSFDSMHARRCCVTQYLGVVNFLRQVRLFLILA